MSSAAAPERQSFSNERVFAVVAAALYLWQLLWIWRSWPYMLDDALIHLRYADNLRRYHTITYDGVHASFGTSSLLFVSILAALRSVSGSSVLPRVVSSLVYAALFPALCFTLRRGLRGRRDLPAAVWLLALGLLAVIVAPSAVRWLDDGMETGLMFLDALLGVLLLRQLLRGRRISVSLGLAAFVYGLFAVLLRVELLSLVSVIALMAGLEICTQPPTEDKRARLRAVLSLMAGALAAVGLILSTMHALLPDTAYAKGFGWRKWMSTFQTTGKTVLGSTSVGLGLLLLWLLGWWALRREHRMRAADWIANLFPPALLLLAAARGQQVFFIRYFGWAVFFSLMWNVLRLADLPVRDGRSLPALLQPALIIFLVALVPAFAWESRTFDRVFRERNTAFDQFRLQPFEALRGQLGIAEDIGFLGYFTGASLCDPYGLVNGLAAARLDYNTRFARCMAMRPRFVFGSREALQKVTQIRSLAGWSVCGTYNLRNVRSDDVHYLVIAPTLAPAICPGGGTPVAQAIPGLL